MLDIVISERELWDEEKEEFVTVKEQHLILEHSLVSISKWEAKWHKSFLSGPKKTTEEIIDYIRCMTITQNVKPEVYQCLTNENITQINSYIKDSMTATFFSEDNEPKRHRIITSEVIYCWMITLNIPIDFQRWHLNRLLTLIRVCNIENQPKKKRNQKQILDRNAKLNEARRKKFNTRG